MKLLKWMLLGLGLAASTCGRANAAAEAAKPEMVIATALGVSSVEFAPGENALSIYGGGESTSGFQLWGEGGLKALVRDPSLLRAPVFSRDGKYLVAQSRASVAIRESATGRVLRTLPGLGEVATNGDILVSLGRASKGSDSRRMRVLRVPSGKLVRDVAWSQPPLWSQRSTLSLSDDGRFLGHVEGERDGVNAAQVWDVGTGNRLCTTDRDNGSLRTSTTEGNRLSVYGPILFAPDGRSFWSGGLAPAWRAPDVSFGGDSGYSSDVVAKEWDLKSGRLKRIVGGWTTQNGYLPLAFSSDGRSIVCGASGAMDIIRLRDGKLLRKLRDTRNISISPDRSAVVVALDNFSTSHRNIPVEVYSTSSGQLLRRLSLGPGDSDSIKMALGRQTLAVSSYGSPPLAWWNWRSGKRVRSVSFPGFLPGIVQMLFSRDGSLLGSHISGDPGLIVVWDARSGRLKQTQSGVEYTYELIPSADGKEFSTRDELIAGVEADKAAKARGRLFARADEREVVSPDGSLVAVAGGEARDYSGGRKSAKGELLNLYSVGSKQMLWQRQLEHGAAIEGMTFGPDSKSLLTEQPSHLLLWDVASGTSHNLKAATAVKPLTFSANGKRLCARIDAAVHVWDVASGKPIATLDTRNPSSQMAGDFAISPDGKRLACSDADGAITLYDVDKAQVLARLIALMPPNGSLSALDWIAVTPSGFYDASPGAQRWIRWRVGNQLFPAAKFERALKRPDMIRKILAAK